MSKCLNISDKKIKALADQFGEVITSDAIDKWEALGNVELPTVEQMKPLEELTINVDSGMSIEESHKIFREAIRKEPSMSIDEKMLTDLGLDKHLKDYTKNLEAIEGIITNSEEEKKAKDDELAKLVENFMRGNETANVGISGEQKQDMFKTKLRSTYTGINGFENDFETEKALVELANENDYFDGKPFEANFKENIESLYEEGLLSNNTQKIELAKRLRTLDNGQLTSLFTFFHSSQNVPYLKLLWKKAKQGMRELSIEFSNIGYEQALIKKVNEHIAPFTDAAFKKSMNLQQASNKGLESDALWLSKATGISVEEWKVFAKSLGKDDVKKVDKALHNYIIASYYDVKAKQWIPIKSKQEFLDNLTKAKAKGQGSSLNTIAKNTSIQQKAKYILPRFKNSVWNLKSSAVLDSHLVNRFDKLVEIAKDAYYSGNEWVQTFKDKDPIQVNIDGLWNKENQKSQEAGKLSDEDLKKTLVENYEDTQLGSDYYLQATGQFGDKDLLHMVQVKKYKNKQELQKKYRDLLIKQGATSEQADIVIREILRDAKEFENNFGQGRIAEAELFALNYAYNFNMVNDFINGDVRQYGKKDSEGKWKTAPIIDLFKRNGSTASPGMYGNKYVKGGMGEGFTEVFLNDPNIDGYKPLDGQSFITRALSDKINKSFGSIFDFKTSIKAITSFVDGGSRFLDKTNSIVIDELAAQYPNSVYAKIFKFMQDNGIDKVSTKGGIKIPGKAISVDFFKKGTSELNPDFKYDANVHNTFVKTEDYLVQQDLTNDGSPYETTTPIQRTKNMIHDQVANQIATMFNEIGAKRMKEMSDKILTTDKNTWVKYILGKVGLSEEEIINVTKEEALESDFADLDQIERLLAKGTSLNHPDINKWLSRYVANVISKQALGRITSKILAVEVGYVESKDFKLNDYREEKGKVYMPQSAVPFNSKLRGPRTFPSKKAAMQWIMSNKSKCRDMFTGFDENNNQNGIHEHELEMLPDGRVVVPGELHLITRVPADNMHSHTLARVKYILPEKMGNVIITNHTTTEISGADFDGDQRTIESLFKDKQGNSNIAGEKKQSLANKAIHMQMQWFYNVENMKTALMPINLNEFDNLLGTEAKKRTKDSPATFIDSRKKNNVGLAVVGMMANLQSVYDFLRKHESFVKKNEDEKRKTVKDYLRLPIIKNGKLTSHKIMGNFIDSDKIKNTIGNLLNLSLDNVKDPKIERLGLNEVTVKMFVPALMTGTDVESVVSLFRTPTAKRFVSEMRQTGSVDNIEDIRSVFAKLTEEVTNGKEEKLNVRNDVELKQSDLTSPLSKAVLRKLLILSSMSYEYDKLNSVIRLTEQAPKSWVDYQMALRNFSAVRNNQLKYIDTTKWNGSEFIESARGALRVSRDYFGRFSNEQTYTSQKLLEDFEADLQESQDYPIILNRQQLAAYSKAINTAMLMMSRQRMVKFEKWSIPFIANVVKLKAAGTYPIILKSLQVEDNNIEIREDLKRNPIPPIEEKKFKEELNRMFKSTDAAERQFANDLIDYNIFKYEMSPSTVKGSYSQLFSDEIHKEIGDKMDEVVEMFANDEFDEESYKKIFKSIKGQNPIFEKAHSKDNGTGFNRIYEPFAETKLIGVVNNTEVFNALAKGTKTDLKIATTGINKDIVLEGKKGDVIEIQNGTETTTLEVESIEDFDKKKTIMKL